jgi:stage V sporulation protein D (sporulation-specific penicillin-binding protein)
MKYNPSSRINILYLFIIVAGFVLVGQLFMVQIVHGNSYRAKAESQYSSPSTQFSRGGIYFTQKDGTPLGAAILKSGYILAINPELITDAEGAYSKLSNIITIDKTSFLKSANKQNDPYEQIATKVSENDAKKIEALKLIGVRLYPEKWRSYPGGESAAHILGFVGYQGNSLTGRYGLEQYYNDTLTAQGPWLNMNFFAQVFAPNKASNDANHGKASRGEGDVHTTIEPSVQNYLESRIKQAKEKWNAESVGGIIMDPKTGNIYAMSGLPTYNPNDYSKTEISLFTDPLTQKVFEMGSIVKALTMAAGLDSGAVTTNTTYDDKGTITLNGSTISNWDFKARGPGTTMQQVLNDSLNLGATFVMEQMGKKTFDKYMRSYGIGDRTGIDLPNEASGIIDNLKSPRLLEHATASFGQGIAMTPIETVRALSSLANGGKLPNPHLVSEIDYANGPAWNYQPKPQKQVLKKSTTDTVTKMLVQVFDNEMKSLGKNNILKHYSVATKTGTAQIPNPSGGYYVHRYLNTWFGYFPAYNPRFIVFLYIKHPVGAVYSSQTLVNPFVDISQFLLNYYEIPPDR